MAKTIVSIVSKQTVPNYLLIKELFREEDGDKLLFITTKESEKYLPYITDSLSITDDGYSGITLDNGTEEQWDIMCRTIESALVQGVEYHVNLTGGTKYIAMAVRSVFEKHPNSKFYYIPNPKNYYLLFDNKIDINYRISVNEFLNLHGIYNNFYSSITQSKEYSDDFLQLFVHEFNSNDFHVIDLLRSYRNTKRNDIHLIECRSDFKTKYPQIPNLTSFLTHVAFPNKEPGFLTDKEVQFITGGWFEEYVYYLINDLIKPDDIQIGVKLGTANNDLDVIFTKGNKLFVVECKTGIQKDSKDSEKMLREIVYKASAIRDHLKGISADSYIFALSPNNDKWKKIATHMGVTYCGRETFLNTESRDCLINSMLEKAC